MVVFPFKVGDDVLLCSSSRYYGIGAGATGYVKEFTRDYSGRIKEIIIEWTWTPIPKKSEAFDFIGTSPNRRWNVKAATEHLRVPTACDSCVHRLSRVTDSCQGKQWTYSARAVQERLEELKKQKTEH